jgi:hypothetical protein
LKGLNGENEKLGATFAIPSRTLGWHHLVLSSVNQWTSPDKLSSLAAINRMYRNGTGGGMP